MKQKKRKTSQRGKSRTSSKQNYEISGATVIVTCPHGHKNQAQRVSDRQIAYDLVCARTSCRAEWKQMLPQITGLEEV
jgi:hypothetical protein